MKKKEKQIWEERLEKGLCRYCGANPHDIGSKTCIPCKKARYLKYKNQAYMSPERQKAYRKQIRTEVLQKYGGKCACCSETTEEFLTIDHMNDDGNVERRKLFGSQSGYSHSFYLKLRREEKRSDLQVLCYNCNSSFARFGYSPKCPECVRKGSSFSSASELES